MSHQRLWGSPVIQQGVLIEFVTFIAKTQISSSLQVLDQCVLGFFTKFISQGEGFDYTWLNFNRDFFVFICGV